MIFLYRLYPWLGRADRWIGQRLDSWNDIQLFGWTRQRRWGLIGTGSPFEDLLGWIWALKSSSLREIDCLIVVRVKPILGIRHESSQDLFGFFEESNLRIFEGQLCLFWEYPNIWIITVKPSDLVALPQKNLEVSDCKPCNFGVKNASEHFLIICSGEFSLKTIKSYKITVNALIWTIVVGSPHVFVHFEKVMSTFSSWNLTASGPTSGLHNGAVLEKTLLMPCRCSTRVWCS